MLKFTSYIKESEEYKDFNANLKDMIKKSLKTSDEKTINDFLVAYKKDPESNQIEGLINDSDIYDMYLKFTDDIDEILNDNDYYSESPKDMNIFSLYDYIIAGTKKAVEYSINGLGDTDKEIPKI